MRYAINHTLRHIESLEAGKNRRLCLDLQIVDDENGIGIAAEGTCHKHLYQINGRCCVCLFLAFQNTGKGLVDASLLGPVLDTADQRCNARINLCRGGFEQYLKRNETQADLGVCREQACVAESKTKSVCTSK